jgi:hypothetical protein
VSVEGAHIGRKEPEANGASAVAVVDAIDQRRQFLAPAVVGREQVRLMLIGGHQVQQHDADTQRLIARDLPPKLLEAGKQESGIARFVKIGFVPPAAEIADPRKMRAKRRQ